jgi:hypothetical protein
MHRWSLVILSFVIALSACSAPGHRVSAPAARPAIPSTPPPRPDTKTTATLIRIAQVFNTDYDHNNDGPVYDRWDARSQAVISRAEYIRRHIECSTAPQAPAQVESAAPGPRGAWLVHYEIAGQQLTDYWYYIHQRWEFDLLLSNPGAARLYRLPFAKYAAQAGCPDH